MGTNYTNPGNLNGSGVLGATVMPRLEATAVIFSITNVNDGLLCEFEKIISESATIIAKIIAQVKYPNIFLS